MSSQNTRQSADRAFSELIEILQKYEIFPQKDNLNRLYTLCPFEGEQMMLTPMHFQILKWIAKRSLGETLDLDTWDKLEAIFNKWKVEQTLLGEL